MIYTKKTFVSEESWLGIDIIGTNKEWTWWEVEDVEPSDKIDQEVALKICFEISPESVIH